MEHETGRPKAYIAQSDPMENTNMRMTHWHRRMARKIDKHISGKEGPGEMGPGARWAIEKAAELLGLIDMIEQPKQKNSQ